MEETIKIGCRDGQLIEYKLEPAPLTEKNLGAAIADQLAFVRMYQFALSKSVTPETEQSLERAIAGLKDLCAIADFLAKFSGRS